MRATALDVMAGADEIDGTGWHLTGSASLTTRSPHDSVSGVVVS
jgi:hypothetical protein